MSYGEALASVCAIMLAIGEARDYVAHRRRVRALKAQRSQIDRARADIASLRRRVAALEALTPDDIERIAYEMLLIDGTGGQ